MLFRAFTVLGVVAFELCAAEKLPFLLPTCKRASSNYNSCLNRAFNETWPILVKESSRFSYHTCNEVPENNAHADIINGYILTGLPAEYDLPPLDPFYFNDYQKFVSNNGPLRGDAITRNLTVIGLGAAYIKGFRLRLNNDTLRTGCNYRIPQIYIEGIYEINGTLAGIRMYDKGRFNITAQEVSGIVNFLGIVKNDTLITKHVSTIPIIKNVKLYLDNPDNSELKKLAIMFVNENWPMLLRLYLPITADYWNMYFCNLLNRFFAKISFSEMVP